MLSLLSSTVRHVHCALLLLSLWCPLTFLNFVAENPSSSIRNNHRGLLCIIHGLFPDIHLTEVQLQERNCCQLWCLPTTHRHARAAQSLIFLFSQHWGTDCSSSIQWEPCTSTMSCYLLINIATARGMTTLLFCTRMTKKWPHKWHSSLHSSVCVCVKVVSSLLQGSSNKRVVSSQLHRDTL